MTPLNACTIVSKNYLPFARVLARSFAQQHPGGRFFTLLVDRVDDYFDPAKEPFEVLEAHQLDNVPDLPGFLFKYTILESNTAIKPYLAMAGRSIASSPGSGPLLPLVECPRCHLMLIGGICNNDRNRGKHTTCAQTTIGYKVLCDFWGLLWSYFSILAQFD